MLQFKVKLLGRKKQQQTKSKCETTAGHVGSRQTSNKGNLNLKFVTRNGPNKVKSTFRKVKVAARYTDAQTRQRRVNSIDFRKGNKYCNPG